MVGKRERQGGNEAPGRAETLGKERRCPEGFFTKFCHVLCGVDPAFCLPLAGGKIYCT